jgi:hypothetical protein
MPGNALVEPGGVHSNHLDCCKVNRRELAFEDRESFNVRKLLVLTNAFE